MGQGKPENGGQFEAEVLKRLTRSAVVTVPGKRDKRYDAIAKLGGRTFAVQMTNRHLSSRDIQLALQTLAVLPEKSLLIVAKSFDQNAQLLAEANGIILCTIEGLEKIDDNVARSEQRRRYDAILWRMTKEDLKEYASSKGLRVEGRKTDLINRIASSQLDLAALPQFLETRRAKFHFVYVATKEPLKALTEALSFDTGLLVLDSSRIGRKIARFEILAPRGRTYVTQDFRPLMKFGTIPPLLRPVTFREFASVAARYSVVSLKLKSTKKTDHLYSVYVHFPGGSDWKTIERDFGDRFEDFELERAAFRIGKQLISLRFKPFVSISCRAPLRRSERFREFLSGFELAIGGFG